MIRALLALTPFTLLAEPMTFTYPDSKPGDTIDTLHGIEVADPYRWLEDLNSKETETWVGQQNELTESYLKKIPGSKEINDHLTELWNYERFGLPFKESGRYFFSKNDGLQNQNVLYTTTSLDEEAEILLDPNKLSEDGTISLSDYSISPDGKHMAYGCLLYTSDAADE